MKIILLSSLIFLIFSNIYAQQDLIDRVTRQAVEIDSLKRIILSEKSNNLNNEETIKKLSNSLKLKEDSIKSQKQIHIEQVKIINDLKIEETEIEQKSDSIASLKAEIFKKDDQIIIERRKCEEIAKLERDKGKSEIIAEIINRYKTKSFDDLLKFSTKRMVQQDSQLIGPSSDLQQVLSDLIRYFTASEILESRFNSVQIKNTQTQLSQIKQESIETAKLKTRIDNYQMFSEGLKETLEKINILDQRETVAGMPPEIRELKLNKILSEISLYIFNFDLELTYYPFLSDVMLKVLKRKQPNPDADIKDLLDMF